MSPCCHHVSCHVNMEKFAKPRLNTASQYLLLLIFKIVRTVLSLLMFESSMISSSVRSFDERLQRLRFELVVVSVQKSNVLEDRRCWSSLVQFCTIKSRNLNSSLNGPSGKCFNVLCMTALGSQDPSLFKEALSNMFS